MVKQSTSSCTGCRLCSIQCPPKAINIKTDERGFFYPSIDEKKCISCNLCEKVCPHINNRCMEPIAFYVCSSKNKRFRTLGSSGGLFEVLADYFIKQNYFICGASWNGLNVEHRIISKKEEIPLLAKSKYLRSELGDSFIQIKNLLQQNKKMVFVGTPCQCASLRNYVGESDNAFYIDFLCHGAPTQKFFDLCLKNEETTKRIKILSFSFRAKTLREPHSFEYKYLKKPGGKRIFKKRGHFAEYPFYFAFLKYSIFQDKCYECCFAKSERCSDLTLGDAWGCQKVSNSFRTDGKKRGASLAIINSKKAMKVFEENKSYVDYMETSKSFVIENNVSFSSKVKENNQALYEIRTKMFNDFIQDFDGSLTRYFRLSKKEIFKLRITYLLPSFFVKIIKTIMRIGHI